MRVRERRVEPELLDHLDPDDPRAIRARKDLSRANALMLQDVILARALRKAAGATPPRVLLDLGSGDGTFMLRVARRLAPEWRNVRAILLDRRGVVSAQTRAGFAELQWTVEPVATDVIDFLARPNPEPVDVITANWFLHHLHDEALRTLFARAAQVTRLFVTSELRRTKLVREVARMQWMIGASEIIRNDGVISARAAFLDNEMSALWPDRRGWDLLEYAAGPMTHVFVARRT